MTNDKLIAKATEYGKAMAARGIAPCTVEAQDWENNFLQMLDDKDRAMMALETLRKAFWAAC